MVEPDVARDASGQVLSTRSSLWPDGVDEAGRLDALHRLGECAERAGRRDVQLQVR
jgi:hypothetical protein